VIGFEGAAFDDALARTDYLVLACPLTETTRGLLDHEAFVTIDPDAVLVVNGPRPGRRTDALVEALRSNWIRGASLDVTDPEPLPEAPALDVRKRPDHAQRGGHTPQYYDRLADIVAENVTRIDDDGADADLENQVLP